MTDLQLELAVLRARDRIADPKLAMVLDTLADELHKIARENERRAEEAKR